MKVILLLATFLTAALSGCQSLPEQITPAITGATGALIGHEISDGDPIGVAVGAAAGVASGTAINYWKQNSESKAYSSGYTKGRSDEVKRLYWISKRLHEGDESDGPFHRGYYEIPVPEHVAADGTLIEEHTQIVEVIEP